MKEQYIMTSYVTDDYISFKTECSCYAHDMHVTFNIDEDNLISLSLEDKMYIDEYYDFPFFKRIWYRIKTVCQILFKGYFDFDYQFVFKGKEHIDEFMKYMNTAYKEIINENTK